MKRGRRRRTRGGGTGGRPDARLRRRGCGGSASLCGGSQLAIVCMNPINSLELVLWFVETAIGLWCALVARDWGLRVFAVNPAMLRRIHHFEPARIDRFLKCSGGSLWLAIHILGSAAAAG